MVRSFYSVLALISAAGQAYALPSLSVALVKPLKDYNFTGIVGLPNCSGSLVKLSNNPNAKALLLSNGHCVKIPFDDTKEVLVNVPKVIKLKVYINATQTIPATTTRVLYSTLHLTDVSLWELKETVAELEAKGAKIFELADKPGKKGERIILASGYWHTAQECPIDTLVYQLEEAGFIWKGSYKYTECKVIGGTSGSPLISVATGKIIGVNNTGNENGEMCTLNNPCEVSKQGEKKIHKDAGYGQHTYPITTCVTPRGTFDLLVAGCKLPKPQAKSAVRRG